MPFLMREVGGPKGSLLVLGHLEAHTTPLIEPPSPAIYPGIFQSYP